MLVMLDVAKLQVQTPSWEPDKLPRLPYAIKQLIPRTTCLRMSQMLLPQRVRLTPMVAVLSPANCRYIAIYCQPF